MTVLDDLVRGDRRTINVSNLRDDTGAPVTFGVGDVLRFTAKYNVKHDDTAAIFTKTSTGSPGGIAITVGTGNASITINPADLPTTPTTINYVWDLQMVIGGNNTNVRTLASGTGRVVNDVSQTVP